MVTISSFVIVFLYTLVVSLVVCNARSLAKSCFVAECVDEQTNGVVSSSQQSYNCLFSSLFFSPFSSFFLLVCEKRQRKFPPLCCWCWLLLNPDSRAQRENQDLLFYWIFCHHEPSLSFLRTNEKLPKTSIHHRPLLFIDSSYINAPNTHTYKMALSMQSALAGKQITVNKVSSKRYVHLIFA